MSFILDALKKSEIERQRQSMPGLMDARRVERRRGLPAWALVVAALLVINLGVLAVVLWKQHPPSVATSPQPVRAERSAAARSAAPAAGAGVATPGVATPGNDHFSPMDSAPVYAPEIPVPADPGVSGRDVAVPRLADAPTADSRGPARVGARRPDPILTDKADEDGSDEILPTINEINLTGPQALPEIHLDVHVWGTKASDRFVFVNGRKYHQGATLQEGPVIDKIRRDGVVLDWRGLRFLLPRQ